MTRHALPWRKSALGQTQKSGRAIGKSALPSKTDIVSHARQVRKVPTGEHPAAHLGTIGYHECEQNVRFHPNHLST